MSHEPVHVGVDIGGTKVLAALVATDGTVSRSVTLSTPGRSIAVEVVEDTLVTAVREVAAGAPIAAVGIAAAGFVDAPGERVMFAPHLPWRGESVRDRLAERLGTPVALDNDANCAALAEVTYGVARESRLSLMITLGTGIGGAIVLDGRVLRGVNGMAGEFGHMQVVPGGAACECGKRGCWEQYCSGNALRRHLPGTLSGPEITDAARDGDRLALAAFEEVGDWLGVGAANLVAALDPDLIVVGGGLSAAGELLLEPARAALERCLVGGGYRRPPRLVTATRGPLAGAVGAATLARVPTLSW